MLYVFLFIWLIGVPVAYLAYFKNQSDFTMFDKVWLSFFWIILIPLYVIHYLHNKL